MGGKWSKAGKGYNYDGAIGNLLGWVIKHPNPRSSYKWVASLTHGHQGVRFFTLKAAKRWVEGNS